MKQFKNFTINFFVQSGKLLAGLVVGSIIFSLVCKFTQVH